MESTIRPRFKRTVFFICLPAVFGAALLILGFPGCGSGGGGGGGQVPVGPAANHPPKALVSVTPPGGTIGLVNNQAMVVLDGGASEDGDNGTQGLAFSWKKLSGPGGDVIASPSGSSTEVHFSQAGNYSYQLTVDDGEAADHLASQQVDIIVTPPSNNAPRARIATDPADAMVRLSNGRAQATLDGGASDDGDGGAQGLTYRWEQTGGPAGPILQSAQTAVTVVTFQEAGRFLFKLTVDDGMPLNNVATAAVEVLVLQENSEVAILSWDPPTTNADGTPITDLAGFRIYHGLDLDPKNALKVETAGLVGEYRVEVAVKGLVYFWVTAIDMTGNESEFPAPVSKLFQ